MQIAGVLVLIACAGRALTHPLDGDFKLHWEFGRRFLAGEFLYRGGHHLPYPPFWAMAHAPIALLPLPIAKALLFPLGVATVFFLLRLLRVMAESAGLLARPQAFWAATLALVLAGRFVIRDLAELGVNTELVALTWLAIFLWRRGRDLPAGISLGLAIALKCTPAIFAGYFLWKRQWRMFAFSTLAALTFTLAPILWQGPMLYRQHMSFWLGNAWQGFGNPDPSRGVLGPEPVQNMALRPSLARYLMHLPADHPGRPSSSLYLDVLHFSPVAAGWVIKGVLLLLLVWFLWWTRKAIGTREAPRSLWECAALSILMLLFSPITWGQHCVALIPACYLISAAWLGRHQLPRWMLVLLGTYIVIVPILSRDVVGRNAALLLASYHLETLAIVGLLVVVFGAERVRTKES